MRISLETMMGRTGARSLMAGPFCMAVLLAGCGGGHEQAGGEAALAVDPADPFAQLRAEGRELFNTRCIVCHMADGLGQEGVYPPLAGSPFLLDEDGAERATKILLHGRDRDLGAGYKSPGYWAQEREAPDRSRDASGASDAACHMSGRSRCCSRASGARIGWRRAGRWGRRREESHE